MQQDNQNHFDTVVIGGGLTGLTMAYNIRKQGVSCAIVEREDRCGGQIKSYIKGGFVFESGPNTGTISNKYVVQLFKELESRDSGALCEIQVAKSESNKRLICKGGRLYALPSSLGGGVTTPLFRFRDKLRILLEPWRKRGENEMESVAELAARRLGRSFVDYAVDPFIGGIYAGDPNRLVTKYAMPKLYNLEQEYGSFIKGSIKRGKAMKAERVEQGITKQIFSTKGGLSSLVEALESVSLESGVVIYRGEGAVVEQAGSGWRVVMGKRSVTARSVVTATPAYNLPDILPFVEQELMGDITSLNYAGVVQVSLCYDSLPQEVLKKGDVKSFGALIPFKEGSQVLGILFPSACFDGRANHEGAVMSVFVGGVRHKEVLGMSDSELESMVLGEVEALLGISQKPRFVTLFRHPRAIPQYEASSKERFEAIEKIEAKYQGLKLRGNMCGGIGMADRIKQGFDIIL